MQDKCATTPSATFGTGSFSFFDIPHSTFSTNGKSRGYEFPLQNDTRARFIFKLNQMNCAYLLRRKLLSTFKLWLISVESVSIYFRKKRRQHVCPNNRREIDVSRSILTYADLQICVYWASFCSAIKGVTVSLKGNDFLIQNKHDVLPIELFVISLLGIRRTDKPKTSVPSLGDNEKEGHI